VTITDLKREINNKYYFFQNLFFKFFSEEEGEELFYKRGFEFKLPYPCLNDFEANFGNVTQSSNNFIEISNNTNVKSALIQKNSDSNLTQKPQQTVPNHAKRISKSSNASNSSTVSPLTTHENTTSIMSNNLGPKIKSTKNTKNQDRGQTNNKQQFHHHSQLHQIYNSQYVDNGVSNGTLPTQNNYCLDESSNFSVLNQNLAYKFNSNYHSHPSHLENQNTQHVNLQDNRINYYSQNLVKTELIDEPNAYDSKSKFNTLANTEFSSAASSLSSSSISSTTSSSNLSTIPSDASISINISNSAYHYGNYFNGLNGLNQSSYGCSRYLHENQNKIYTGSSSSSSPSPFFLNNQNTTALQNSASQNSTYNFYNHQLGQHYHETNNEANNLHSNSSCSSTSSISSSNSLTGNNPSLKNNISNLFNESGYNNNSFAAAAAAGILWPKSLDSEIITSATRVNLPVNLHNDHEVNHQHYHNFNHGAYETTDQSQLVVNNQLTVPNNYSELFSCSGNVSNITGPPKYSCGAAVASSTLTTSYCQYPFAIDDYSSVSQI
jgi:hypothetical protein